MPSSKGQISRRGFVDIAFLLASILVIGWMESDRKPTNPIENPRVEQSRPARRTDVPNSQQISAANVSSSDSVPISLNFRRESSMSDNFGSERGSPNGRLSQIHSAEEAESLDFSRQDYAELKNAKIPKSPLATPPTLAFPYGDLNDYPPAIISAEELAIE